MKLYLDLDGCLTDFEKAYKQISGKDMKSFDDVDWKVVESAGIEWWANMPWMPDGKELWQSLKDFNPTILSAPSRHKDSRKGKKAWVKRELGEDVPLILENEKWKYADPDSLLIDDRDKNIYEFIENGGFGILHENTDKTLQELLELAS